MQALHIFKHLDIHSKNELAFDPAYHYVESDSNIQDLIHDMKSIYVDTQEDIPPNAPEPRGRPMQINCSLDSDHAGDKVTRVKRSLDAHKVAYYYTAIPPLSFGIQKGKTQLRAPLLVQHL